MAGDPARLYVMSDKDTACLSAVPAATSFLDLGDRLYFILLSLSIKTLLLSNIGFNIKTKGASACSCGHLDKGRTKDAKDIDVDTSHRTNYDRRCA